MCFLNQQIWFIASSLLVLIIICGFCPAEATMRMNQNFPKTETSVALLDQTASAQNQTKSFSRWSPWSRCQDCLQRRMKTCVSSTKCHSSVVYEERPCSSKKRCKRKFRHKADFHVIQEGRDNSHLTRQAPARIWSKWSKWSPCSGNCRTKRVRNCKKPGRCRKRSQEQTAYCYHENSMCEDYVMQLMRRKPPQNNENERTDKRRKGHQRKCGQPFRKTRMLKIIGGAEAKKHKWPWHVAILNRYYEVFCGGTLIGPRWVLTASHCIRPILFARLNEHNLRMQDGREMEFTIHRTFQHPSFNPHTVDNDIALLQLPTVVNLPVACLPNKSPTPRELCYVMGWGKLHTSDTYGTDVLQEAVLPIVDMKSCKNAYRRYLLTPNMLCAGWSSGKSDTCAGDSGGGLICPTHNKSKTIYSVHGITSFGDGCGLKNKYGIYTTVFNYLKWIYYIMDHYS